MAEAHVWNPGRHMTFLGHIGNQATTHIVKEPRNRGKKGSNPFVPVTPLVLIWSLRPGLCGKLISSNTCLLETDGWFSWGVIDVFFFSLYLCVCAVYLQPAVPIWWSDLGSIMSSAGVLFWVVALAPTALWVIRNPLQQAYPKHTTAVKGVARSKLSLRGFYWFTHLSASLLLLITDQGTASRTKPWATGAQLEPSAQWQAA